MVEQKDYQDGSVHNTVTGADSAMELSGSNVLRYELEDGTSFIIRPSGTEPQVLPMGPPAHPIRNPQKPPQPPNNIEVPLPLKFFYFFVFFLS